MAIWERAENFVTGGAQDDLSKYYQQGQGYMQPWQQGGADAFNDWRGDTQRTGQMLGQYGNPADYSWRQINQSPMAYYNNIMSNYQESPEAKYNQEQAQRAGNAAASASGMMGSGAYANGMQENANRISMGDRNQYYNNVMGANQAQQQSLQNFQNEQARWRQQMAMQSQMGLQAGSQMSNNAMHEGDQQAYWDDQGMKNIGGLFGTAANFGMGYGGINGWFGPQYQQWLMQQNKGG